MSSEDEDAPPCSLLGSPRSNEVECLRSVSPPAESGLELNEEAYSDASEESKLLVHVMGLSRHANTWL